MQKIWNHFSLWHLLMIIFPVNFKSLIFIIIFSLLFVWIQWKVSQWLFLEVVSETNFLHALSILKGYVDLHGFLWFLLAGLHKKLWGEPCTATGAWTLFFRARAQSSLVHLVFTVTSYPVLIRVGSALLLLIEYKLTFVLLYSWTLIPLAQVFTCLRV